MEEAMAELSPIEETHQYQKAKNYSETTVMNKTSQER